MFSSEHIKTLLGNNARGRLLDIGAGDGGVTLKLAGFFDEVVATEVSEPMVRRLTERGYRAMHTADIEDEAIGVEPFDVISLLNVLDRCDKPLTLLRQIRTRLRSDGVLILAVVLPFCAFVESGADQLEPSESLDAPYRGFEANLNWIVADVFNPTGWTVRSVSRLPYLCQACVHKVHSNIVCVCALTGRRETAQCRTLFFLTQCLCLSLVLIKSLDSKYFH